MLAGLLCGSAAACIAPLPVPETGDHAGETPVPVPFAPPPARVDVILDPPPGMKDPVWLDGQWLWKGSRWVWDPGAWRANDPNQVYAKPAVVRRADRQLVWFQGKLRPKRGVAMKEVTSP